MSKQKGSALPLIIILVLSILVLGVVAYWKFGQVPEPNPTLSSQPTSKTDETRDWKTYKNSDWGVIFNYPQQWDVKPYGNDSKHPKLIELQTNSSLYIEFSYINNSRKLTLQQIDDNNAKKDKERGVGVDTPRVAPQNYTTITTPNGYTAYYEKEYPCEATPCERYTIISQDKIIQIIVVQSAKQTENYQRTINQILSTFKFLD